MSKQVARSQALILFLAAAITLMGCQKPSTIRGTPPQTVPSTGSEESASAGLPYSGLPLTAPDTGPPKTTPDFTLTAQQLHEEYEKDNQAATQKYKGKTIQVTGVVDNVDRVHMSGIKGVIRLRVGQYGWLQCVTADPAPWRSVFPTQKLTIKGILPATGTRRYLTNCEIVEKGPSPAVAVTSEQLAREYAANREGTLKKYEGKWIIVTGKVLALDKEEKCVDLSGTDKVRLRCLSRDTDFLEGLEEGQRACLVGPLQKRISDEQAIFLGPCKKITK